MCEDILHRLRVTNQHPDIQFTPNMYNEALVLIQDICLAIANKTLVQLGCLHRIDLQTNFLIVICETQFNVDELGNKKKLAFESLRKLF
jgi:hypothetical protein